MAISRACASRIALCEQLRVLGKGRIAPMSRRRTKCIVGIAGVEARSPTPQVVLHLHLIVPMKEQSRSEPVGTLAPEKHLFLNVRRECLLGTLRGKNPLGINKQLNSERFSFGPRTCPRRSSRLSVRWTGWLRQGDRKPRCPT